jgi:Glycosyltransferase family 9 (heptosyltransferase)
MNSIPAMVPYLRASDAGLQQWRERATPGTRPKVGIAWAGSRDHGNDRNRSIRLRDMLPMLAQTGVQLFSLQKDLRDGDAELLRDFGDVTHLGGDLATFDDAAAIVSWLDLVVSVDTSLAHLAGALGKPVWILLPFIPDWRWLLDRDDNPWYPTARLFRQQRVGDWTSVIARVALELSTLSGGVKSGVASQTGTQPLAKQVKNGAAAIVLAADGQDPPEEIPRLISSWRAGAAVVWAERRGLGNPSLAGQLASQAFHGILRRLSGLDTLTPGGCDYFLVSRPVIQVVNSFGERNSNVVALLAWIGFEQAAITYDKGLRTAGKSGWTLSKKLKMFLDSVIDFSVRPLQAISVLGFVVAMLGFVYAAIVIANAIFGRPVEGWSSLMVVVLIVGGVQMVMLGVLGEYLWRALDESRGRPRYVVERRTDRA